jgi:hypothetical protein
MPPTPAPGRADLLQGTLDLLILRTLGLGPHHGLGLARRIEQITHDAFHIKPGSLFPALYRLEERGWIAAGVGRFRHQAPRQVLPPDESRPETAAGRDRRLAPDRARHGARARDHVLGARHADQPHPGARAKPLQAR